MADMKGRILIVDDEKLQREIIILTLKKEGHELAEAASVREALALLDKREFDLILTDLMMQGQTGMDLLEQIQKVDAEQCVIMMTAHGSMWTVRDVIT